MISKIENLFKRPETSPDATHEEQPEVLWTEISEEQQEAMKGGWPWPWPPIGGGGGGAVSGRSAATGMTKLTWLLGVAFIITSLTLTVIVAQQSAGSSVIDRLGVTPPAAPSGDAEIPAGDLLLPPSADDNTPLVPLGD